MSRPPLLLAVALAVLACTREQVRQSNKKWSDGLVVARNMCASDGSVQHTKDPQGQRIYCGLEEILGSHIPKCVCRDEMQMRDQREEAKQYLRDHQDRQPITN
jgi:hypothetical protein